MIKPKVLTATVFKERIRKLTKTLDCCNRAIATGTEAVVVTSLIKYRLQLQIMIIISKIQMQEGLNNVDMSYELGFKFDKISSFLGPNNREFYRPEIYIMLEYISKNISK